MVHDEIALLKKGFEQRRVANKLFAYPVPGAQAEKNLLEDGIFARNLFLALDGLYPFFRFS